MLELLVDQLQQKDTEYYSGKMEKEVKITSKKALELELEALKKALIKKNVITDLEIKNEKK